MQVMIDLPEVTLQEVRWRGLYLCPRDRYALEDAIKNAVPVVHGRWINIWNGNCDDLCKCSECKETWLGIGGYNYCPHCGAKMDGEEVSK